MNSVDGSALAWWISPKGLIKSVGISHVRDVVDCPEAFGLDAGYVHDLYKKYNEPLGFEGKARDIIVEGLIRRGWVRIRYIPIEDVYSVEVNRLTGAVKDYLAEWAGGVADCLPSRVYSVVVVCEFGMGYGYQEHSILDVSKGVLYQSFRSERGHRLTPVFSVWDLLEWADGGVGI
jgi:hypothetical protein